MNLNTTGQYNTAVGYQALKANTTGINNTVVGYSAMVSNTIGAHNTALGFCALRGNTTGNLNTALGINSLKVNTIGHSNVSVGANSLVDSTEGNYNTASGLESLANNTTGDANSGFGYQSLLTNITGDNNTGLGFRALKLNTASYNIGLGRDSGDNITSGTGNVIIGSVDATSATGSRQLKIAGYDGTNTTTWITGDSSGKIGIGTTSPQTTLHIAAQIPKIRIEDTDLSGMAFDIRGAGPAVHFDLDPGSSQALADYMWDIGGSTKMKLRGTGRLGIGTTTPSQALDVVGSIEVSDGIYIGGTAAANKLDDYEEGTFTPTIGPGDGLSSVSYTTQSGVYTKVGRIVHFRFFLRCSGTANGNDINIYGLPFTSSTSEIGGAVFAYLHSSIINSTSTNPPVLQIPTNNTFIKFQKTNGSDFTGNDLSSTGDIQFYITGTYETA
jgi:hypothetical protein